jgi:membrane fusion protein (multidrug efflux system)
MRFRTGRILVAAICAAILPACSKPAATVAPPIEVPVVQVIQRDTPITAERVGQIYGAEDIELRARVAGFLESIHFKEGSTVRKGDLLYTIDPREQQEKVAEVQGELASAKTRLVKAQSDVRRYRPLAEMHAVSQADLDSLRSARISLGYTRISSPIDGLIGMTQAKVGDYVGQFPNPVVLNTVSNVSTVQARFAITERDYLDLVHKFGTQGEGATRHDDIELLLADGSVYPHKGSLDFADRQVDPSTGTLRIQASFPNPDRVLRPGQYARVRIVIDVRKGALLVPQRAVQELQGQQMVSIVGADDAVESRTLQMGPRIGGLWMVDQGLKPGDRVILEGAQKVRPGTKVVPKEVPAPDDAGAAPVAPTPAT